MKSTLKVLILVPNLRVSNGVASFAMNYFKAIDHSAIHMDFAVYADIPSPYYDVIKEAGSTVYALPAVRHLKQHLRECRRILRQGNYDIVHDNTLINSLPMMMCAKQAGVPVRILHSHSSRLGETELREKRNKLFVPLLKKLSTDYAACSATAAASMFGSSPYFWIPNIVLEQNATFSAERRSEIRQKMGAGREKTIIGTVGRITPAKNPFFALEVINSLTTGRQDYEYWWIGSGAQDEEFRKKIAELGNKNIKLLGSRDDAPDLYQAMDVFFLPSRFEGLPLTVVEAQAMGLPCVISDVITPEVDYTDLVKRVSPDEPVSVWVSALEKQAGRIGDRRPYTDELRNSEFTEHKAGERLDAYYRRLIDR